MFVFEVAALDDAALPLLVLVPLAHPASRSPDVAATASVRVILGLRMLLPCSSKRGAAVRPRNF